jgi:autotransporter-associated beta strand protein
VTIGAGASTISLSEGGTGSVTVSGGAISATTGGTVDFTLPVNTKFTTTTANRSGQQTILGGFATYNGESTWAVSGTGGTAGAITGLSSYSPTFTATTDVDAPTGTSTPGTITINSLRFNSAGSYTVGNTAGNNDTLTIISGGILDTATTGAGGTVNIAVANLVSNAFGQLVVIQNNPLAAMTISSTINGLALTKSGAGTLILTGTSSGATYVNAGTLQIGSGSTNGSFGDT